MDSAHPRTLRRLIEFTVLAMLVTGSAIADLVDDVQRAIPESGMRGAGIAISIRDSETSRELFARNARTPMMPASNMKLLTTGTALHVLGGDFEFRTGIVQDGDRLIVVGDGDPGFGDPTLLSLIQVGERQGLEIEEFLALWVDAIVARGISVIDELVVDDRVFDREFVHDTWPRDQLNRRYCAEVSGFMFHLNLLSFYPEPVRGRRPIVSNFEPYAPWLDLSRNRATCKSGPQDGNTFAIARPYETNDLTFFGNVKTGYSSPVQVTMHDMPEFFARLLADRLKKAGVVVRRAGAIDPEAPETSGERVAPVVRTPITTAVTRCNRDSQNLYAEALLKRAGHAVTSGVQPGSWRNGGAAVRLVAVDRLEDDSLANDIVVADGSGLSRDNRVTASLLTSWLDSFHRDPELGEVFIESLAVAGVNGTLRKRFKTQEFAGVTVQAKSGFINGVSCLSGFVTAPDGRRRSFSVLVNDFGSGSVRDAKALQEAIVAAIAEDLLESPAVTVEVGG